MPAHFIFEGATFTRIGRTLGFGPRFLLFLGVEAGGVVGRCVFASVAFFRLAAVLLRVT